MTNTTNAAEMSSAWMPTCRWARVGVEWLARCGHVLSHGRRVRVVRADGTSQIMRVVGEARTDWSDATAPTHLHAVAEDVEEPVPADWSDDD